VAKESELEDKGDKLSSVIFVEISSKRPRRGVPMRGTDERTCGEKQQLNGTQWSKHTPLALLHRSQLREAGSGWDTGIFSIPRATRFIQPGDSPLSDFDVVGVLQRILWERRERGWVGRGFR